MNCRLLIVVLFLAEVAFAQTIAPIHIGKHALNETIEEWSQQEILPHQLSESFSDWLKLNQLDLNSICAKHSRSDNTADYKKVCKALTAIQQKGVGEFYTTSDTGQDVGWRFVNGRVVDYSFGMQWRSSFLTKDTVSTIGGHRIYDWKFSAGRLSEVHVRPEVLAQRQADRVLYFLEEVDFLTQAYGKPVDIKTTPYHNAYGAQWEASSMFWSLSDGTKLAAFERTEFNMQGKLLEIVFSSKEAVERERRELSKPNPYK